MPFPRARRSLFPWLAVAAGACSPHLGGTGADTDLARGADAQADIADDAGAPRGRDARADDAPSDAADDPSADSDSSSPDDGAGAHDDAAIDGGGAPEADTGVASDAGGDAGHMVDASVSCEIPGRYAVDLRLDVSWNDTSLAGIVPLLRRGTGQLHIMALVDVGPLSGSAPAESSQGTLRTCGATLPDFATENLLVSEQYSVHFPDGTWDSPAMPTYPLSLRYGCTQPGCSLIVEQVVATYGAQGGQGVAWPERSEGTTGLTLVDHDGDGYPGVSVLTRGPDEHDAFGTPYSHVPVSWTLNARALKIGVPLRVSVALSGKQVQCGLFTGAVGQATVDARAVACQAMPGSGSGSVECNANQVDFLDQNFPAWTVVGGSFQAVRVEPSVGCAGVRAMF